jgi:Coenzyme F420-dependent N5,N10-methylene tetrahydromethanopterin reductase and related flavin-dependent oxidoreductases
MTRLQRSTGISPEFALWRNLIPPTQRQALHNPQQMAAQLQEFIDPGCSGFCLSGYPHHVEAKRFGRLVMPLLFK